MKRSIYLLLLLFPIVISAQHQIGWRTDSYAGINSASINPAAPIRTPLKWDINLLEGTQFFTNNYAYFVNTSVPDLLRNANVNSNFHLLSDLPQDISSGADVFTYEFYDGTDTRRAFAQTTVMGPSFSVQLGPNTRVGLISQWRMMGSLNNVDSDFSYYHWNNIPSLTNISIDPFQGAIGAWAEVGLNVSHAFPTASGQVVIGGTFKKLWGQRAAYFQSDDRFDLSKLVDYDGLEGITFDIHTGASTDLFSDDAKDSAFAGGGFAIDLGVLYQIDLGDGYYKWEFGASLIDAGIVDFANIETHHYAGDVLSTTLSADYENLTIDQNLTPVFQQLSQDVYQDPQASLQPDTHFEMDLPTSISLQGRYAVNEWAKVDATFIANVFEGNGLDRLSLLAITPRIDRYWWSVATPVSLAGGKNLRMGLSARLGPLFIGTDQLGSFFKNKELYGADFYAGIKWQPLGLNRGKSSGKRKKSRGRGGDVECYKW